jgi:hypothetical protein
MHSRGIDAGSTGSRWLTIANALTTWSGSACPSIRCCHRCAAHAENLVVALIACHLGIFQMRDRAAHGGGVVHGGDLHAGLIELLKIRHRRPRLHDVGGIGNLIDRPERHLRHPFRVLGQECDVPLCAGSVVGDLPGVPMHDIFDCRCRVAPPFPCRDRPAHPQNLPPRFWCTRTRRRPG